MSNTEETYSQSIQDSAGNAGKSVKIHHSKRRGRGRRNQRQDKRPRVEYEPLVKDNENMVKFYKLQPLFEEGEFDRFMECLRETLPASFRINTFEIGHSLFLRRLIQGTQLKEFLDSANNIVENKLATPDDKQSNQTESNPANNNDIENLDQPKLEPLIWYPKRFGWQMNLTRLDLKRSPFLQQFHRFIMAETDNGFISRQEAVSMIPPLVLDVHRGQNILDMCAAPGSKTAQLLEYLKYDIYDLKEKLGNLNEAKFDDGMVVANDVDNKRCYMLVHQSNRLKSPNCIIINQDASRLPNMKIFTNENEEFKDLKFDRILCDVPCSGDGTVRKNPDVWKKWTVGNTNNFHGMQVKILKRGVELLKENGLLVYSTCSMSPVEDEAVIASILRLSQGSIKLEACDHKLPGLKFKPGISQWTVLSRDMEVIPSVDKVPPESVTQLYSSLFQPTKEESKKFELHKCIRILPHLQNTGGFFVAVLRKLTPTLPWEEQALSKVLEKQETTGEVKIIKPSQPSPKKRRFGGFKEDPFFFITEDDPDWINIRNVYGLSENFPFNQLLHRCAVGKKRSIHLVSRRTRNFIIANQEEPNRVDFVKLINGGMRLFSRADTEAGFRICQDGVCEVLPYIKDDFKVLMNKEDLVALLKSESVPIGSLSFSSQLRDKIKKGSFILIYNHQPLEADDEEEKVEMPFSAWLGEKTVALYVSRTYRTHLCALAGLKITDDGALPKLAAKIIEQ